MHGSARRREEQKWEKVIVVGKAARSPWSDGRYAKRVLRRDVTRLYDYTRRSRTPPPARWMDRATLSAGKRAF